MLKQLLKRIIYKDNRSVDISSSKPPTQSTHIYGDLMQYFSDNSSHRIHKWLHYFDIYEKHLYKYRGSSPTVLEIGIQNGGSAQMWKSYFGDTATIIGVDIDPACMSLESDGFKVHIGDQADRSFWAKFKLQHEYIDIVIDDGGHSMAQQITTFQEIFPILSDGGIYICEDTHSSYFPAHGGGKGKPGTFHELVKSLMDEMHAWYHEPLDKIPQNYYANHLYSISVYDSIIAFEKRKRGLPVVLSKGLEGHINLPTTMTHIEMRRAFGVSDGDPSL